MELGFEAEYIGAGLCVAGADLELRHPFSGFVHRMRKIGIGQALAQAEHEVADAVACRRRRRAVRIREGDMARDGHRPNEGDRRRKAQRAQGILAPHKSNVNRFWVKIKLTPADLNVSAAL